MPRTARRSLVPLAIATAILALGVASAFGGSPLGGVTSRLHSTAALAPSVSVPHVSVPHVSVPSVPHVSVPSVPHVSVPHVSVPSVPHVSTPSGSGVPSIHVGAGGGPVAGAAGRAASGSASASSSSSGSSSSGGGGSGHGSARTRAASVGDGQHARQTHDQRLRGDVQRFAGCLDALPGQEGHLLALRAGLGTADPLSRVAAAQRLGITKHREAVLERSGLRRLRAAGRTGACGSGGSGSTSPAVLAATSSSIPQLQPAVLLASHPGLTSPASLARPPRNGRADGGSRSSGGSGSGSLSGSRTAGLVHGVESGSSTTARYLAALVVLGLLTSAILLAWRRREPSPSPRLADQAGTAAVWWPPSSDLPEAPSAPPGAAVEVTDPLAPSNLAAGPLQLSAGAAPPATLAAGAREEAPAAPRVVRPVPLAPIAKRAGAAGSARRHPVLVTAATLVSVGAALLRSRRRRR